MHTIGETHQGYRIIARTDARISGTDDLLSTLLGYHHRKREFVVWSYAGHVDDAPYNGAYTRDAKQAARLFHGRGSSHMSRCLDL